MDARRGEQGSDIEYWLKLIQILGADAPVIVVINKIDQGRLAIDQRRLLARYDNIKAFIETSSATGSGLQTLKEEIARAAAALPHIHTRLPNSWFAIKSRISKITREYISYEEYEALCQSEGIDDRISQETLINFLHDLGTVICFRTDLRLKNIVIINPHWVVNSIYRILDSTNVSRSNGILDIRQLSEILPPLEYSQNEQQFFLDLMQAFELGVEIERGRKFLIPEMLSPVEPEIIWDYSDSLGFQYHYEVLPSSVFTRFIVRMHAYASPELCWRNGIVLTAKQNSALVKTDQAYRIISIYVTGERQTRRGFLQIIRYEFRRIHESFSRLQVKEMIPLPDYPEVVVDYAYLLNLLNLGVEEFYPAGVLQPVAVRRLLNGIELSEHESGTVTNGNILIGGEITIERPNNTVPLVSSPLITGLFYLFWFVAVISALAALSKQVGWGVSSIVIIGSLLAISTIGALQLRQDGRLSEASFLELLMLTLRQLPLIGRAQQNKARTAEQQRQQMYPWWAEQMMTYLLETNRVSLTTFPKDQRDFIRNQFVRDYPLLNLKYDSKTEELEVSEKERLDAFRGKWEDAEHCIEGNDIVAFRASADELAGIFCEALAFKPEEQRASLGQLYGRMVDASNPAFDLSVRPRFPLIFLCKTSFKEADVNDASGLLNAFQIHTDFFALLIAFGDDRSLRQIVHQSFFKNDFIILNHDQVWNILASKSPVQRLKDYILEQIDLVAVSPYVWNGAVSDEKAYVGRAEEEKILIQNISHYSYALLANRKMGKTSLLNRIVPRLRRNSRFLVIQCDLQAAETYDDFYKIFYDGLAKANPESSPLIANHEASSPLDFIRIIRGIGRFSPRQKLILVFDEVDQLLKYDLEHSEEQLFKTFRSLSQGGEAQFIFSGTTALVKRATHPDSPFFNFCEVLKISHLDQQAARDLVTKPMHAIGVEFDSEMIIVDRILKISSLHPNMIQYICAKLIDKLNDKQQRRITEADIEEVAASEDLFTYFERLIWGQALPKEKLIVFLMWSDPRFAKSEVIRKLKEWE